MHYKNNLRNGKYLIRKHFNTYTKGHYKNGLKDGKWIIKGPYYCGTIIYSNGNRIKAYNEKFINKGIP